MPPPKKIRPRIRPIIPKTDIEFQLTIIILIAHSVIENGKKIKGKTDV
jgi:hypothetical protein